MKKVLLFVLLVVLTISCQRQATETVAVDNRYATGFSIEQCDDWTRVVVANPWQTGQTLATYYLVKEENMQVPADGIKLMIPLSRLATTSCTHIGFLKAIGGLNSVCGVCDPSLIYNSEVLHPADGHEVYDIGDAMQVNVERVLRSAPQAVMVSTYAQGDAASEQLQQLGVPVIYNNEWTEQHPLARAEWLRFVAAFYDCLPQADSLFTEIEKQYMSLVAQVNDSTRLKPKIMSGNNFRGTWYVPSGATYMGKLFADAGADYYYADDESLMSIPLTVESVVKHFADADVWVGSAANSLSELVSIDKTHSWFKAYKEDRVYNFYAKRTETGANDFWETGVVHPEYVLHDLVNILYPDLLEDKSMYYTKHLR